MAITRTPIHDDDGSGTTGTIIDNAWKQELYNQIDALPFGTIPAPYRIPSSLSIPIPGSVNDWNPAGGAAAVVWYLQPAVPIVITGIVGEAEGTMHLLVNGSGSMITLMNAHPNSANGNKLVCPGYNDYQLSTWNSLWIRASAIVGGWLVIGRSAGALLGE